MTTQPDPNHSSQDLLACIDGSIYADSVCAHAAWASKRLQAAIRLLHIQEPSTGGAPRLDLSGHLGLGARSKLLEELAQMDEERSKLNLQKGRLILAHGKEQLQALGISEVEILHRRGSLVETLTELEGPAQLILIGKRGEHANFADLHLGSNLERVVRAAHKPILVCSRQFKPIERFGIAFDGGASTVKAVNTLAASPLLQGLECRLFHIGTDNAANRQMLDKAAATLKAANYTVETDIRPGNPDKIIAGYVEEHGVNLLVMGAYGHSRIRTLIIGSTTSAMLRSCRIPMLMFR